MLFLLMEFQIVFDMDGTLSEAHINFADMRKRTGVTRGPGVPWVCGCGGGAVVGAQ